MPDADAQVQASDTGSRLARATVTVSIFTGLSRLSGLGREILASSYFGTSGAFSAFTIAFQIPNLVSNLFSEAALSAAFIPVFAELLEQDRKDEAFRLATTLLSVILAVLGVVTIGFIIGASAIMSTLAGSSFTPGLYELAANLSRVMFLIVPLLGVNAVFVGVLQVYGRFGAPTLAAVVWNGVILVSLIVLRPHFHGGAQLYAYAIGILLGTVAQLLIALYALRAIDFRIRRAIDIHDARLRRIVVLTLPVTITLGIANFDSVINSVVGTLVSSEAPRAVVAAFRLYMLPQGLVAIPIATVLFPTMGRLAARGDRAGFRRVVDGGLRQVVFLLVPVAMLILALSGPIVQVIYQRGAFTSHSTDLVASALAWFAVSLPFAGGNLLLTRGLFALQKPWVPARMAIVNLTVDLALSVTLYRPLGIAGVVIGTAVAAAIMFLLQLRWLVRHVPAARRTSTATFRSVLVVVLASGGAGACARVVWGAMSSSLGETFPGEVAGLGVALMVGFSAYAAMVTAMRVPEARIVALAVARRMHRG